MKMWGEDIFIGDFYSFSGLELVGVCVVEGLGFLLVVLVGFW